MANLSAREIVEDFATTEEKTCTDPYLQHGWVSVCVDILSRNIARAEFEIQKNGKVITDSAAAILFRNPGQCMSSNDLWKETASWLSLEGEAFWWFGPEYSAGIPKELVILNPRYMHEQVQDGVITHWTYTGSGDGRERTILKDELIHFKDWNPWNQYRGVSPLVSLNLEMEQDLLAGRQNTGLLKEGGVPKGLLKTDQILTEADSELLERIWDRKYSRGIKNRVAVLGKGTSYQPLTFSPDTLKLYDMKNWNLYTLLAKYGIPPRVANIHDAKSSLSGTDTESQHRAFWNYTLIPMLQSYEKTLEVQFFGRFKLKEKGVFNLTNIPELQESEDAQSNRDIAEIQAGLLTINEVLERRGMPPKPWGNEWHWKP